MVYTHFKIAPNITTPQGCSLSLLLYNVPWELLSLIQIRPYPLFTLWCHRAVLIYTVNGQVRCGLFHATSQPSYWDVNFDRWMSQMLLPILVGISVHFEYIFIHLSNMTSQIPSPGKIRGSLFKTTGVSRLHVFYTCPNLKKKKKIFYTSFWYYTDCYNCKGRLRLLHELKEPLCQAMVSIFL